MEALAAGLQIVWRNPEPVRRPQRWEQLANRPDAAVYLIQEFVSLGEFSFWSTKLSLEVVYGGRAA
jgi:hypothetical protein